MVMVMAAMVVARRRKGRSREQEHEGEDNKLFHTAILARLAVHFGTIFLSRLSGVMCHLRPSDAAMKRADSTGPDVPVSIVTAGSGMCDVSKLPSASNCSNRGRELSFR